MKHPWRTLLLVRFIRRHEAQLKPLRDERREGEEDED